VISDLGLAIKLCLGSWMGKARGIVQKIVHVYMKEDMKEYNIMSKKKSYMNRNIINKGKANGT
jgi:hypothetical protein